MFKVLTSRKLRAVLNEWGKNPEGKQYDEEVCKAQLKQDMEDIIKWGEEWCGNVTHSHRNPIPKKTCTDCWQELKGGVMKRCPRCKLGIMLPDTEGHTCLQCGFAFIPYASIPLSFKLTSKSLTKPTGRLIIQQELLK